MAKDKKPIVYQTIKQRQEEAGKPMYLIRM
jgi:hypothetical protein